MEAPVPPSEAEEMRVPIVFQGIDDVPVLFCNQLVVQHQQNEFVITFGQLAPPILLGTPEERREQAKQVPYVAVKVVARIGLTSDRMVEFIKAMQDNLRKYQEKRSKSSG